MGCLLKYTYANRNCKWKTKQLWLRPTIDFFTVAFFMLTVFFSKTTENDMPRSVLRKVKANLWLCFPLKHWERRPAADDSASVYFQLMMWQAVGQTKLDMLFSALHKQTHKMLNHKIHVFSQNQECILPLQSELCKIVNRLARSHEYWLAFTFSSGFALPIALSR